MIFHDFDPHNDDKEDELDDDSDDFDDGFWYKPQTPGEEALGRGKNLQNDDRPPSLCGAHTQIFVFSDLDDRHHPISDSITTKHYKHIICALSYNKLFKVNLSMWYQLILKTFTAGSWLVDELIIHVNKESMKLYYLM